MGSYQRPVCPGTIRRYEKHNFMVFKFGFTSVHLRRGLNKGSHSLIHLFKKCEIISWTCLHLFRWLNVTWSEDSEAESPPIWPWRKRLGVSGVASFGSGDLYASGGEFNQASSPTRATCVQDWGTHCLISTSYFAGLFDILMLLHIWQNCVYFGDCLFSYEDTLWCLS